MIRKVLSFFTRVWVVYACMFVVLYIFFNRNQVADDVLNTARPSADYLHFFAYGTKPLDVKEFKRAKAYYLTLISGKFSTAAMHANLGFCDYYLKNIPGAIEHYKNAIQMDQKMYAFYLDLGMIYQGQKDYQKAQDMFKKAVFLLPKNKNALLDAMHISSKYREHLMFEYYFQQRLPWDRLIAYVHLLECLSALKMYPEVLGFAVEAIKIFPNDPEFFYYASLGAYNSGYVKEAVAFIMRAIEIAPTYAKGYELKAGIMHALGDDTNVKGDMLSFKQFEGSQGWHRVQEIQELHHWDENTLLFQIYR